MPEPRIMTHLVAGFPDLAGSREAARAMADGGAAYLEVQFPYSDPTADGPLIQRACDRALRSGFRVREGFRLVGEIRSFCETPVFIMGYAGMVYAVGVRRFLEQARASGASGVIVPDLPVDSDEGLYRLGAELGLEVVPVVSPNIQEDRLGKIRGLPGGAYLYAALRAGITGAFTQIGEENLRFLNRAAGLQRKVVAGFGISRGEQVRRLAPHVHAVVAGSVFIRALEGGREAGGPAPGDAAAAPGDVAAAPGGPAPAEVYRRVLGCLRELCGA